MRRAVKTIFTFIIFIGVYFGILIPLFPTISDSIQNLLADSGLSQIEIPYQKYQVNNTTGEGEWVTTPIKIDMTGVIMWILNFLFVAAPIIAFVMIIRLR